MRENDLVSKKRQVWLTKTKLKETQSLDSQLKVTIH